MSFWVYILRCSDDSYYTGHTDDLGKRIGEHQAGLCGGYTASRLPVELAFSQDFRHAKKLYPPNNRLKAGVARKRKR